jgi:hypothetical protein
VLNVFAAEGIRTLADVVVRSERDMRRLDNLGDRSLVAIKQMLVERGLRFGIEFEPSPSGRYSLPGEAVAQPKRRPQPLSASGASIASVRPLGSPVIPTPSPAADLTFGDMRFGFAIGRPGI